eukprot:56472-Chlamydomonas_euryale.AAC.2
MWTPKWRNTPSASAVAAAAAAASPAPLARLAFAFEGALAPGSTPGLRATVRPVDDEAGPGWRGAGGRAAAAANSAATSTASTDVARRVVPLPPPSPPPLPGVPPALPPGNPPAPIDSAFCSQSCNAWRSVSVGGRGACPAALKAVPAPGCVRRNPYTP